MKERPILFSGPMVKAILDGTKTQTRRVVKPQPHVDAQMRGGYAVNVPPRNFTKNMVGGSISVLAPHVHQCCPYGQPGDRLWVRETWNITSTSQLAPSEQIGKSAENCARDNNGFACSCSDGVVYRADGEVSHPEFGTAIWRPSIFMPRWASRITLEVTGIRVERLQDISEADAEAEGIEKNWCGPLDKGPNSAGGEGWCREDGWIHYGRSVDDDPAFTPVESYRSLWDSINAKTAPWASNPWVWVVEFKRSKQ